MLINVGSSGFKTGWKEPYAQHPTVTEGVVRFICQLLMEMIASMSRKVHRIGKRRRRDPDYDVDEAEDEED